MAQCYRHPSRETNVSCSNCGKPICPSCMTPTPVGMRCPDCAGERTQVRTAASIRSTTTNAMLVTFVLIGLNVVAFLASGQFGFNAQGGTAVWRDGLLFGPYVNPGGDYWRLVTYGFLHSGLIHIGFNMFLLYVLGQMLEPVLGHRRFAAIYAVGLLGGAFGALVATPDAATVGASGAVFGLMGAAAVELRGRGQSIMEAGIGGLILINLLFSFVLSNVSVGGHIGGLVFGTASAYAFHWTARQRQPGAGWALQVVLAAIAVAGGIAAAHTAFGGAFTL
jgi:membrane associated rhomboid family serine protease